MGVGCVGMAVVVIMIVPVAMIMGVVIAVVMVGVPGGTGTGGNADMLGAGLAGLGVALAAGAAVVAGDAVLLEWALEAMVKNAIDAGSPSVHLVWQALLTHRDYEDAHHRLDKHTDPAKVLAWLEEGHRAWLPLNMPSTIFETAFDWLRRNAAINDKAPRAVVFGELPKTSTGKIQKFVLRESAKSASAIDS